MVNGLVFFEMSARALERQVHEICPASLVWSWKAVLLSCSLLQALRALICPFSKTKSQSLSRSQSALLSLLGQSPTQSMLLDFWPTHYLIVAKQCSTLAVPQICPSLSHSETHNTLYSWLTLALPARLLRRSNYHKTTWAASIY